MKRGLMGKVGRAGVAGIAYHEICRDGAPHKYAVSDEDFERQVGLLVRMGCECLTIDEFSSLDSGERGEPAASPVLVTFDDGHVSHYEVALSVLERNGVRGTFFTTTDWIGSTGYMDRGQLLQMHEAGMSVQSHGASHSYLDGLDTAGLREELGGSKRALEDLLGAEVEYISFPGGRYSDRVLEVGREMGFKAFVSSDPYAVRRVKGSLLVGRVMIKRGLGEDGFRSIASCRPDRVRREKLLWHSRRLLRRWIGDEKYGLLWRLYAGK